MTRQCGHCGSGFESVQPAAKYCTGCRGRKGGLHPNLNKKIHSLTCSECGAGFQSVRKEQAHCSRACGHKGLIGIVPKSAKKATPPKVANELGVIRRWGRRADPLRKAQSIAGRRADRLTLLGTRITCRECGTAFCPLGRRTVFCSAKCDAKDTRRKNKLKRKAAMRGAAAEKVNPSIVFDRDGWQCQQCGCDTPQSHRGTCLDTAPELDHIYPISKGGLHSYANTQCLCRACNQAKSDTIPDQTQIPIGSRGYRGVRQISCRH